MKQIISIFTSTLLFVISFGINAEAQLAKQGNFNGKFSVGGKVLSMHMIVKAPAGFNPYFLYLKFHPRNTPSTTT